MYYSFLVDRYDFTEVTYKKNNSMLYDLEYTDGKKIISISYEIMGEGINIVIFKVINGRRSGYDDMNTIHLNQIVKKLYESGKMERFHEEKQFIKPYEQPDTELEKEALKKAELLSYVMNLEDFIINLFTRQVT